MNWQSCIATIKSSQSFLSLFASRTSHFTSLVAISLHNDEERRVCSAALGAAQPAKRQRRIARFISSPPCCRSSHIVEIRRPLTARRRVFALLGPRLEEVDEVRVLLHQRPGVEG